MSREKMLTLEGINHASASGRSKDVLDTALAQVGFIPNMYANMANQPAVLDTYLHGYALFREESGFTPPEQEVVFLTISHENNCEYCVAAHSMLAVMKSGVAKDVVASVCTGEPVADARLSALETFTRAMVKTRGNPARADLDAFLAAGYTEQQVLSIVLAISVKVLSNYSNHLFNTEIDGMFAPFAHT